MADGSLKFNTRIDTNGFVAGTNTIKKAAQACAKAVEETGIKANAAFNKSGKVTGLENQILQTETKIRQLKEEMARMKELKVPTEEYRQLSGLVEKTQLQMDRLIDRQEKMKVAGTSQNSKAWKSIQYEIETTRQRLETYKIELQDTINRDRAFSSGADSTGYEMKAARLDSLNNRLLSLKQSLNELIAKEAESAVEAARLLELGRNAEIDNQKIVDLNRNLEELKLRQAELESAGVGIGFREYDQNVQRIAQINAELRAYRNNLHEADSRQRAVTRSAGRMGREMKNVRKAAIPLTKSILKLSNMFKLMLIRMAMRAVIRAVREGFENLAQYSEAVNTSMSSMSSSLLYLKNSFVTAFTPVLNGAIQGLNALIDAIANALAWIGQLLAVLTGKGTFIRAKKTQEDYAASLKKTGSAAKQAGKEAKKALAPFDELNTLADKGTAGTGGGGSTETDPSQMFETVDVDSKITSMVAGMKQALNNFYSWMSKTFGPNLAKVWTGMQPNIEKFKSTLLGMWTDLESLGEPLKVWVNADLVPFLQQTIDTMGFIVNGLFDSFNMVFADIWNLVVFPFLQKFITEGLPMMTQFATEIMVTLEPLFALVKDLFDRIWRNAIAPALELIAEIWAGCIDALYEVWQEYGHPIFEAIREAISRTGEVLNDIWDRYVKPVFDTFMDVADRLWTNHIQPLLKHFLEFGAKLIQVALDIYNSVILPLVSWFADILGPQISGEIQIITEVFGVFGAFISGIVDSIILVLNGVLDFIHTGFTQGWDKAWSKVSDIYRGIFDGIVQIAENAINYIVDSLNGISFDVPEWIPKIGGETFGFSLDHVRLPRLATGTVVPPRAGEFAAILGDNNREAEVVSPISAMKQAFREVVEDMKSSGGDIYLTVNLEGKTVYEEVIKQNRLRKRQTGKNPLLV